MEEVARKSLEYGYRVITEGLVKERKWNKYKKTYESLVSWNEDRKNPDNSKFSHDGRSKLKGLIEPLRTFENKEEALVHFSKYLAYTLPRSGLYNTRDVLLQIENEINSSVENADTRWEIMRLTIGYLNWTMDSILSLAGDYKDDKIAFKEHLEQMVKGDGIEDVDETVRKIFAWRSTWNEGRR